MTHKFFFAGSGGQGIVLMGQMLTYGAMFEDKQVTFLPSYGPEMRGGTANCTVVVSDKPVSCPLIYEADCVIAMNQPSMEKFEQLLRPNGILFLNSSLVQKEPTRTDIQVIRIPANDIAKELGTAKAANVVMLGALIRATNVVSEQSIEMVMRKTFVGKKANLIDLNMKAFTYQK